MEDAALTDAPERDREEIERYIKSHGGAIVLRCNGKIGSEAQAEFIAYKKANGYAEPPHDFVWIGHSTLGRESSAAAVDGAGSVTRSGHHEAVGERQGRQPARLRFWCWLTGQKPEPTTQEPLWLDDDDPLARVINDAWLHGSSHWTDGEPSPPKVATPRKVEARHAPDCLYPDGACSCGVRPDQDRPV